MTNISYKATNRSNTLCIARFGNAVNDVCHRNSTVREVFRGSLIRKSSYVWHIQVNLHTLREVDSVDAVCNCFFSKGVFRDALQ